MTYIKGRLKIDSLIFNGVSYVKGEIIQGNFGDKEVESLKKILDIELEPKKESVVASETIVKVAKKPTTKRAVKKEE
jgi:hypothetical protein